MRKTRETRESRVGRKSRKPICVIWTKGDLTSAALIHPITKQVLVENSSGSYAALGKWKDKGYDFSDILDEIPKWVNDHIPKGAEIVGVASIISFPING